MKVCLYVLTSCIVGLGVQGTSLYAKNLHIQEKFVPVEGPVATLKMISDLSRSNYERIRTWQGKYKFSDTQFFSGDVVKDFEKVVEGPLPKEFTLRTEGTCDYAICQD